MAHTDRDHPSIKRFWNWHEDHCACGCHSPAHARYCYWNCSCMAADPLRPTEFWVGPAPSWWHKDQRRAERSHARNLMNRARVGHVDWDDLSIGYRRPYYW